MLLRDFYNSSAIIFVSRVDFQSQREEKKKRVKDNYSHCFDFFFSSFFRALLEKKTGISLLNQLQLIIVVFLTLINKLSDRDRNQTKLVAFLENLKFMVVLTKHSCFLH